MSTSYLQRFIEIHLAVLEKWKIWKVYGRTEDDWWTDGGRRVIIAHSSFGSGELKRFIRFYFKKLKVKKDTDNIEWQQIEKNIFKLTEKVFNWIQTFQ